MQTARRLIAEGALGAIGQVRMDFWLHHDFRGSFREAMAHPLILDMAIHHFDLLRFVTGLDPVSVRAESWNPPWSQFRGDASAACLFTMTNGARVLYDGSWHARGQHTGWNGDWLIEGERGCLRIVKDRLWLRQGPVHGGAADEVEVAADALAVGGQEALLDEVIAAIRAGRPAPTTGADNWLSVAMVLQAVASLTSGARETIAPLAAQAR